MNPQVVERVKDALERAMPTGQLLKQVGLRSDDAGVIAAYHRHFGNQLAEAAIKAAGHPTTIEHLKAEVGQIYDLLNGIGPLEIVYGATGGAWAAGVPMTPARAETLLTDLRSWIDKQESKGR